MNSMDAIIDEYVSSDENGRLHLFLAHRDLRDSFIKIDLTELFQDKEEPSVQPAIGWIHRLFQYCQACFKLKLPIDGVGRRQLRRQPDLRAASAERCNPEPEPTLPVAAVETGTDGA
jgi:hypothetical protein